MKKAVVLVSGGMDSAVVVAMARAQGFAVHALSVRYGQRHTSELDAAQRVAESLGAVEHKTVNVDLRSIGGSALTDESITVPTDVDGHAVGQDAPKDAIPVTYVPARNTIMLSVALGWAEVLGANDLFCGVNAVDYSGYPDCRPEFVEAFEKLANLATKAGVEGAGIRVHAPLQFMSKADIAREGVRLGVDFAQTVSCYQADNEGRACGHCDACRLRAEGFAAAGIADPTRYV
ncbi:7-cyano-7-deazaguanine synthase QueC [Lysobacter auxotrophicus]|uniref:7-cyano-7-deazaguanine synthase n=1 Tax=Lysobacter auxotrophicus TaxID=2992573 RepID=A0ABM8DAM4_9GAMM|nr:7-cyano-7-deazaguanine synthase QueC [Lysobacter auxotrophicus]BDU15612.1 7-cyano-7-deazaguanine synthase QueC [Lysobacter auxotrophicus]